MRSLQMRDVFELGRVINKIGIKEEFAKISEKLSDKSATEVGVEIMFILFAKAVEKNSEKEIYKFLSGPLEMKPEEVGAMDPFKLAEKVLEIAPVEKWQSFLSKAIR